MFYFVVFSEDSLRCLLRCYLWLLSGLLVSSPPHDDNEDEGNFQRDARQTRFVCFFGTKSYIDFPQPSSCHPCQMWSDLSLMRAINLLLDRVPTLP